MTLFAKLVNYAKVHGKPVDIEIFGDGSFGVSDMDGNVIAIGGGPSLTLEQSEAQLVEALTAPLSFEDLRDRIQVLTREEAEDVLIYQLRALGYTEAMDIYENLA